jgi:hypothetical protein
VRNVQFGYCHMIDTCSIELEKHRPRLGIPLLNPLWNHKLTKLKIIRSCTEPAHWLPYPVLGSEWAQTARLGRLDHRDLVLVPACQGWRSLVLRYASSSEGDSSLGGLRSVSSSILNFPARGSTIGVSSDSTQTMHLFSV